MNRQLLFAMTLLMLTGLFLSGCVQSDLSLLRVALLCDPQLGFITEKDGAKSYENQVARLKQAVSQINDIAPDMVLIAGDLVDDVNNDAAVATFKNIIGQLKAPVLLTPGNHDLPDPITVEGLQRYRSRYGEDFRVVVCKGRCIISANSQFWRGSPSDDSIRHERLLLDALAKAKNKKQPIVMLTHIPPYKSSIDEADEYFNIPQKIRKDILRLCEENGVILWLAGHTHITARRNYEHLTILNGETTSVNFDDHPCGFRLLTIHPDQHFDWDFVAL